MLVLDYGHGNIRSVVNALEHIGVAAEVGGTPEAVKRAEKIVIPGVGAFGSGMDELTRRGLIGPIQDASRTGKHLLGICLGMQLLFDGSMESGERQGLGIVPGWVRELPRTPLERFPNIGWLEVKATEFVPSRPMYFVHGYYGLPLISSATIGKAVYGDFPFCCAVRVGNTYGVQFHPEKSGRDGLQVLKNFAEL